MGVTEMAATPLSLTAQDCPDCGHLLRADDSDDEDIHYVCDNDDCDAEFAGRRDTDCGWAYVIERRVA